MAIRFTHDGKRWEADTAEEAIRLREALETASLRQKSADGERLQLSEQNAWTPDVFTEFVESIPPLGQQFLKVLMAQPQVLIPSTEINKALGFKKHIELAGVLSGLSKQLKKLGMRPHQLYFVDVSWNGKQKERGFAIDREFLLAAEEIGWPEDR